ncbi:hypothetical protein, partial [Actinocrispum sp. NPDC049592]|uniref:hypothetical protein n=1 Tax=Actinocrispum sp. NPDC049592 TaxID=3154835 RepID=UPI003440B159
AGGLAGWRAGGLAGWRAGGLAGWRAGGLAGWRTAVSGCVDAWIWRGGWGRLASVGIGSGEAGNCAGS